MRSKVFVSVVPAVRIAAVVGAALFSAGCSSEITRLSQPFFSDSSEITGSVTPIPQEDIGALGPGGTPVTSVATTIDTPSSMGAPEEAGPNIPRATGNGFYTVRTEAGDTAYSLSRRYGVSVRSIMAANNLSSPEDLRPGQEAMIPPLSWKPGSQVLSVSRDPSVAAAPTASAVPASATKPAVAAENREGVHVVRSGDTLWGIARDNGVQASDLARHNGLGSDARLRVGQRLRVPAAPVRTANASNFANDVGVPAPAPAARPDFKPSAADSLKPLPPQGNAASSAEQPQRTAALTPEPASAVTSRALPEPPSMSAGKFRWPVRGRVISPFGTKPNGAQNDGINIAVPEGTSIKAAENGVVAYVGNELKGYGNLILIRHGEDWVSAYAHASEMMVKRGDQVRRGQIIAKAGRTGAVSQPQLHFELRKGSRPVDPMRFLDEG